MGYTSRELDEEMWKSDIEIIAVLEPLRQELKMKERAASISMAFTTGKDKPKGKVKHGRRN